MYNCEHCGAVDDYNIVLTEDGYKEYRCACCGAILYRTNLLEEYQQVDVIHCYTGDENLDKLYVCLKQYKEDKKAVVNYINFLSTKRYTADEYDSDVYDERIKEFSDVSVKLTALINSYADRIKVLKKEQHYEDVSANTALEYDPTKTYKFHKRARLQTIELAASTSAVVEIIATLFVSGLITDIDNLPEYGYWLPWLICGCLWIIDITIAIITSHKYSKRNDKIKNIQSALSK